MGSLFVRACVRARAYMSLIAFAAAFLAPVALVAAASSSFAGADAAAPEQLAARLWAADPAARAAARDGLVRLGPAAVPAIVGSVSSVGRKSGSSRELAWRLLDRIGAKKAVPALISLLGDPALRINAGSLLFSVIGPESAGQAGALLDCVRSKPEVRNYCGTSLLKAVGPKAKGQIKTLEAGLSDAEPAVRLYSAAALGRIGRGARKAVPALQKAAQDRDSGVAGQAAEALRSIGG
jgi:HEAT repeat protein